MITTSVSEVPTLKDSLSKCLAVDRPWLGWTENYAKLLVDILALGDEIEVGRVIPS